MLGGRLPPVDVCPDRLRVSSSCHAANLQCLCAALSKSCCSRREAPENADGSRRCERRHGL